MQYGQKKFLSIGWCEKILFLIIKACCFSSLLCLNTLYVKEWPTEEQSKGPAIKCSFLQAGGCNYIGGFLCQCISKHSQCSRQKGIYLYLNQPAGNSRISTFISFFPFCCCWCLMLKVDNCEASFRVPK